jgi:dienelactone hydrolase
MRRLAIVALVAACGPAAKTPAKPVPQPLPPPAPTPIAPVAEIFDDLVITEGSGTEHLVISKREDGWLFESDYLLDGAEIGMQMASHLSVTTDRSGSFESMVEEAEVPGPTGDPVHFTLDLARDGSFLTGSLGATNFRFAVPDLWAGLPVVNQLAGLCLDRDPRERSAIADKVSKVPVGAAEVVDGDVTRSALGLPQGAADLYCAGDRFLALDGPGDDVYLRQGGEERFASARRPAPTPPALPTGITESERSVKVAATGVAVEVTLSCSVVLPSKGKKRVPGVAIVHEGANYDRDGDVARIDDRSRRYIYRQLAYDLALAGISSIRCDTRHNAEGSTTKESVDSVVADGAAMLEALATEKGLDAKRIGLVGIRDGATVAPRIWKRRPVRVMALVEGADRSIDTVLLEASDEAFRKQGMDPSMIEAQLDIARRSFDAIKHGDPLPEDAPVQFESLLAMSADYFRTFFAYDPTAAAAEVTKTAVLLVDGHFNHTRQEGDLDALLTAYRKAKGKKRNKVESKQYADVDSDLKVRSAGDEGREPPWWTPSSTRVVADIVDFLARSL